MQGDLISRTEVLKLIEDIKCNRDVPKNYGTLLDIMRKIRKLPTAYSVEKVVEQVEDKREEMVNDTEYDNNTVNYYLQYADEFIDIVLNGGKE